MTVNWIGNAVPIPHADTLTGAGTYAQGDTITVSASALGKSFTVTIGTLVTVAQVNTTLAQAYNGTTLTDLAASVSPAGGGRSIKEFSELTATALPASSPTKVVLTTSSTSGVNVGRKMPVFTVSKSSTSGTIAINHDVLGTGPNDWNNVENWDTGVVPVDTDDVIIDRSVEITDGLDQSAVTLASLTITSRFDSSCRLGLPVRNPLGYEEWRATELAISATVVTITSGSGLIKINYGSVQSATTVLSTGSTTESGRPACQLQGTHASNTLSVLSLSTSSNSSDVGWGANGETAVLATLRQDAGTVTLGANVTATTITKNGGTLINNCAFTTLTNSGDVYFYGTSTATTINHNGGTLYDFTTSTWTTLNLNNTAVANFDGHVSAKTVTNLNQNDASVIINTAARITTATTALPRGRLTLSAS